MMVYTTYNNTQLASQTATLSRMCVLLTHTSIEVETALRICPSHSS